jgi:hypothetical protein
MVIAPWWCPIICFKKSLLASTPCAFCSAATSSWDIMPFIPLWLGVVLGPGFSIPGIIGVVGCPQWPNQVCTC